MNDFNRKDVKSINSVTPEMYQEIDRLGLDRVWFQNLVNKKGLEFGQSCLSHMRKGSQLFDKWYPRLVRFAQKKRTELPLPQIDQLGVIDSATLKILEPKILESEHKTETGQYTAIIFTAPIHVISFLMESWPSTCRNSVFLTPEECKEWKELYDSEEPDQDTSWTLFEWWDAIVNPPLDSIPMRGYSFQPMEKLNYAVISWGHSSGPFFGSERSELWNIDEDGHATFTGKGFLMDY